MQTSKKRLETSQVKTPQAERALSYISAKRQTDETHSLAAVLAYVTTPFRIDLERMLHSSYFRRLQGKTQVLGVHESDFFRTRLTHTLETANIGKQIAEALEIDITLVEALCLAHDIGHPPFAHEGARLLDHFAKLHSQGRVRFDDNAQNLRIISRLASSYELGGEGLNPSASMIDGLIKYKRVCTGSCGWYKEEDPVVAWASSACQTGKHRNPLASVVEIADDLAYTCHDIDDAIRADLLRLEYIEEAFETLIDPRARKIAQESMDQLLSDSHGRKDSSCLRQQRHRVCRSLLSSMLGEVLEISRSSDFRAIFHEPVHHDLNNPYLDKLPHIAELLGVLKSIILERVIYSPNIQTLRFAGLSLMQSYLDRFWPLLTQPEHPLYRHALFSLPKEWQGRFAKKETSDDRLRLLLDYVAGMSDEYLMNQASMFFNPLPHRALENRK